MVAGRILRQHSASTEKPGGRPRGGDDGGYCEMFGLSSFVRWIRSRQGAFSLALWLMVSCLGSPMAVAENDDFQYWSRLSVGLWSSERWSLDLYSEGRLSEDASHLSGVFVGPRLAYRLHPNLSLAMAAKRIDTDRVSDLDGRFELEVAPRFEISDRWQFDSRHRFEVFHFEQRSDSYRFRHRLRWTRTLGRSRGPEERFRYWSRLFFSNEVFHLEGEWPGDIRENRFVPLGGRWQISERSSVDLFVVLRSRETPGEWVHENVVGTLWVLKAGRSERSARR